MKIIVVGCGKIGGTIIASLVAEGHDITAIDNNPDVLSQISDVADVMGICGNGVDYRTLLEAGADTADLLIAATESDETNMLISFLADRMGTSHTIARIRTPEYNEKTLDFAKKQLKLGLSINPDRLAAHELYNLLKFPSAVKVETFAKGNLELVELMLKQDSQLDGLSLIQLREKYKQRFLVCAVQRGEEVFIPSGDFVLHSGDRIGLTAEPAEVTKLFRELGLLQKKARNIMLLGGSRIAWYLTDLLCATGNNVKIIDINQTVCEELSVSLPKAVIIHGDGAQQELLMEEGLSTTDAFVCLTGMDEENILIGIYATTQNVPKVISKVNRDELASLATKLGLDCLVSPSKIVSNVVLRYVRALQNSKGSKVETLYRLMDDHVEALEFIAKEDEELTGIPLKKLKLRKNILIGGIIRDKQSIIPAGDDMINPGDSVIVLTTDNGLQDLSDILR